MTREEIAHILREIRLNAGFTQKEAAEKLGRKQQTLASWETGQSQPDANTLFILCSIYGISVDDAFGFSKKIVPTSENKSLSEAIKIVEQLTPELREYALKHLRLIHDLQQDKHLGRE